MHWHSGPDSVSDIQHGSVKPGCIQAAYCPEPLAYAVYLSRSRPRNTVRTDMMSQPCSIISSQGDYGHMCVVCLLRPDPACWHSDSLSQCRLPVPRLLSHLQEPECKGASSHAYLGRFLCHSLLIALVRLLPVDSLQASAQPTPMSTANGPRSARLLPLARAPKQPILGLLCPQRTRSSAILKIAAFDKSGTPSNEHRVLYVWSDHHLGVGCAVCRVQ